MKKSHTLKEGTILSSAWGCGQTNVSFFQVTRATKKNIYMRPIRSISFPDEQEMTMSTLPAPDDFCGPEVRRKVMTPPSGGQYVFTEDRCIARKWNEEVMTCSDWA